MLNFLVGLILGLILTFGYVRYDISKPGLLELPDQLKSNVISTAAEVDLYDLDKDMDHRRRALEVLFQNRPKFAVEIDKDFNHPFLLNLYRTRLMREARQLKNQQKAFDQAFTKDALRLSYEKRFETTDHEFIKRQLLFKQLENYAFLKQWLMKNKSPLTADNLRGYLQELAKHPVKSHPMKNHPVKKLSVE